MPVPSPVPLHVQPISTSVATFSASTAAVQMPFTGKIVSIGVTPTTATATADYTVTTSINGVSAAGGVVTVVNGTSANTTTSIAPTSVVANQGDQISLAVTGGGSGGGLTTFSIQARRGTL